jgi:RimJ/RimL family protein N-acetyltransferase
MHKTLTTPHIQKAQRIKGKTLVFRNAEIEDASFILSLRTDVHKARFLSPTDINIEKQRQWLENYAKKSDQAYFIIENLTGESIGTIRLYDARADSFCWGSWILKNNTPSSAAIESALMTYQYALDTLGFSDSHFDVRHGNENVWRFHERFGAIRITSTSEDFLYKIDNANINNSLKKYKKYLPNNLIIDF